jgi:hypothetical protein
MSRHVRSLSSRELLASIGLSDEHPQDLIDNEPLDLVLGLFIDSGPARGELLTWHFDSRRFQSWTREV